MNLDRLNQILEEKKNVPESYMKDGYKYFDEAIPALQDYAVLRSISDRNKAILEEKVKFTPVSEERIESALVVKEVNRRIKNLRKTDKQKNAKASLRTKR